VRERLKLLVIVETDMHEHSLRCQAVMALNKIACMIQQCIVKRHVDDTKPKLKLENTFSQLGQIRQIEDNCRYCYLSSHKFCFTVLISTSSSISW